MHGLLILVTCSVLFSSVYYFRRWKQEVDYFQGLKEAKSGALLPSIKSLESAVSWFSKEVNTNYELGNSYSRYAHELQTKGLIDEARKTLLAALRRELLQLHTRVGGALNRGSHSSIMRAGRCMSSTLPCALLPYVPPVPS